MGPSTNTKQSGEGNPVSVQDDTEAIKMGWEERWRRGEKSHKLHFSLLYSLVPHPDAEAGVLAVVEGEKKVKATRIMYELPTPLSNI
jgi:hypothetical protein